MTWEDEEIAVGWNFDWSQLPIGKASDLRREKDGSITAEIVWFASADIVLDPETKDLHRDFGVSIYINPVKYHVWKDHMWATDGRIRALAVTPNRTWPHR